MNRTSFLAILLSPIILFFKRKEKRPPEYALKYAKAIWENTKPGGIYEKICLIKELHPRIKLSTEVNGKYFNIKGVCKDGYIFHSSYEGISPEEEKYAWDSFIRLIKKPKFRA